MKINLEGLLSLKYGDDNSGLKVEKIMLSWSFFLNETKQTNRTYTIYTQRIIDPNVNQANQPKKDVSIQLKQAHKEKQTHKPDPNSYIRKLKTKQAVRLLIVM